MHPNHQIYERALKILETYYQDQQEEMYDVGNTASTQPSTGNVFNFWEATEITTNKYCIK